MATPPATPSVSIRLQLESRWGARFTSIALTPAQAAFWSARGAPPAFVGSAGHRAWEEEGEDYLEEHPEVAELWDANNSAWRTEDPRWFEWDSWEGCDDTGALASAGVFVSLEVDGEKKATKMPYMDFAKAHGCQVRVTELNPPAVPTAAAAAVDPQTEPKTATGSAMFYGFDEEKGVGRTIAGTLPAGAPAFCASGVIFWVTRYYNADGRTQDYVTGATYDGLEDEGDEDCWVCRSGEGSYGVVVVP